MKKSLFFAFLTVFSGCLSQESDAEVVEDLYEESPETLVYSRVELAGPLKKSELIFLQNQSVSSDEDVSLNELGSGILINLYVTSAQEIDAGARNYESTSSRYIHGETRPFQVTPDDNSKSNPAQLNGKDQVFGRNSRVTTPCPPSNEPSLFAKGWKTFENYMVSSGVRACAYDAVQSSSMGIRYPHLSQILSSTAVDVALESGRNQEFDPKNALRILAREAVFCSAQYGITSLNDRAPTLVAQWYGTLQEQKEKKMWVWMACDILPRLAIDTVIALIEAHVMQEEGENLR